MHLIYDRESEHSWNDVYLITAIDQSDDALQEEVNKAHVVCVVYSVEDDNSLDRISTYWLPLIRECTSDLTDQRKPVVIVGNKADLIDYSTINVSINMCFAYNFRFFFTCLPLLIIRYIACVIDNGGVS